MEDDPSGSKYLEDIVKIKILVSQKCVLLAYIIGTLIHIATCFHLLQAF